ncbi:Transcriptional regulator [Carbonactinospora thermoautotrophica]|uniref:Transcriptional regulator n=3 Tax=Carbonactinospora thermoautotrophica TaxID=1469144 RepID=A0A132MUS6_9ACTN|nr:Transcriptional regulator [Carbonactinospora thermoautotrophica]
MDGDRGEYRESPPAVGLGRVVACVWTRRIGGADQVFRVVPDGCVDVIWDGRDLYVAGPDTGPHLGGEPARDRPGGMRFRPGAAPPVLGVLAHALRDSRVPLEELWPRDETGRLAELLAAAPDAPDAASRLERAVAARHGTPPDPAAAAVVASLGRGTARTPPPRRGGCRRARRGPSSRTRWPCRPTGGRPCSCAAAPRSPRWAGARRARRPPPATRAPEGSPGGWGGRSAPRRPGR